jgi:hypothetical protein
MMAPSITLVSVVLCGTLLSVPITAYAQETPTTEEIAERDALAAQMTPEEVAGRQRLAGEWPAAFDRREALSAR